MAQYAVSYVAETLFIAESCCCLVIMEHRPE